MLNIATVQGRLTAKPELRYTQNNVPVCSFSIACERNYGGDGGNRETDFFDCVAWRSIGEFISKYFDKGSQIIVSGHLQNSKYEKNGMKITRTEIIVDSAYFCEKKSENPKTDDYADEYEDDDDGELPF